MFEKKYWSDYQPRKNMGVCKQFFRKVCQLLARFVFFNRLRILLYRMMGMKIGKKVYIGYDCFLDADFSELITIEDRVVISFRVIIAAHDRSREAVAPVLIKQGAFVGAAAIIFPGVTVGQRAIVGAGAVVTKDVEDEVCVAGNPAHKLGAKPKNWDGNK